MPKFQFENAQLLRLRGDIVALVTILALVVALFRSTVFGDDSWASEGIDRIYALLPQFAAISRQEATWRILQDYVGGVPLYNNGNYTPYYPLYFVWTSFYQDPVTGIRLLDWLCVLHIFFSAAATYLGLRLLNVERIAALVGGVSFGLSAYVIGTAGWPHFAAGYAWLPLTLMGILAVASGDNRVRAIAAVLIPGGLAIHAFPAQVSVHLLLAGTMFAAIGLSNAQGSLSQWLVSALSRLGITAVALFALVAAVLVPLAFPDQTFIRWLGSGPPKIGGGPVPLERLFENSLAPGELIAMLLPTSHHAVIGSVFVGLPLIILCLSAFRFATRTRFKIGFLILIVFWTIAVCGDQTTAGVLLKHLPFYNQVRQPPRHMPMLLISVATLAAFGVDDLIRTARGEKLSPLVSGRNLIVIALAACAFLTLSKHGLSVQPTSWHAWLIVAGTLAVVLAVIWPKIATVRGMVLLLCAGYLFQPTHPYFPFSEVRLLQPPLRDLIADLQQSPAVSESSRGRLLFLGTPVDMLLAMSVFGSGAAVLYGYFFPLPFEQFQRYFHHGVNLSSLDLVRGGRFVLARGTTPPAGWRPLQTIGQYTLYENDAAYPMAYGAYRLSGRLNPADDTLQQVETTVSRTPATAIMVDTDAPDWVGKILAGGPEGGPEVGPPVWNRARAVIQVRSAAPALVALNMYAGPAWRASVNGQSAEIVRVNGLHPGVLVPAGNNKVEFYYGSILVDLLFILRLVALAAVGAYLLWAVLGYLRRQSHACIPSMQNGKERSHEPEL